MRKPAFRILRQLRNGARVDVPHPLKPGVDGCFLYADSADAAIQRAREFGIAGEIIAVSEMN